MPGHAAAAQGRVDILRMLLKHPDFNINMPAHMGTTPLMHAIAAGQDDVVELLLAQPGVDVNAQSNAFTVTRSDIDDAGARFNGEQFSSIYSLKNGSRFLFDTVS